MAKFLSRWLIWLKPTNKTFVCIREQLKFQSLSCVVLSLSCTCVVQALEILGSFTPHRIWGSSSLDLLFLRFSPSFSTDLGCSEPLSLGLQASKTVFCWHLSCSTWNRLEPALKFKLLKIKIKKEKETHSVLFLLPVLTTAQYLPVLFTLQCLQMVVFLYFVENL